MCFGMGCSCLQVTLQASQLCEARTLYDQLAVIAPIALALSAGAPIFRGYLADVDCRWNVIAASVDDRTRQERALEPLTSFKTLQWDGESFKEKNITSRIIPKSRYDSVSTFLAPTGEVYNDIPLVINSEIETTLLNAKVDPMLSKHLSHLFIRDPLVIYSELLNQDCEMATDHFENIQSTNWQTMRLKPPSNASPELGWRVEFRPMELQMTDFENAAFSVFLILLSRLILCYELNFYIPISLVDVNMQTAQKRDAVLNGHFWFRKIQVQPFTDSEFIENKKDCNGCSSFAPRSRSSSPAFKNAPSPVISLSSSKENTTSNEDFWALMSMNEIINGSSQTTGLIPMIRSFLDTLIVEDEVRLQINAYLEFISDRAAGKIATNANWIRQFVMKHPHYAKDSRVDSTLVYDLLCEIQKISQSNKSIRVAPVKFP
ncbi:hypothetical protein HMI55_000622 [Coelomomyces lativittatus]|nr:hypothetical protein HMI56_002322 [Coelomomyces lativittatus]KAJ1517104.1 hypothetical protein HMI55_000622 [Coelomomyces lativittatus]